MRKERTSPRTRIVNTHKAYHWIPFIGGAWLTPTIISIAAAALQDTKQGQ